MDDNRKQEQQAPAPAVPASDHIREIFADGQRWIVREIAAPAFDRRGGTHLVFMNENVMRRLRKYPADWHSLSDEALYALSENLA